MSIKARLAALLLYMQQLRSDIYGCQVSGGQIEKVYNRFQPIGDHHFLQSRQSILNVGYGANLRPALPRMRSLKLEP